MPTGVQARIQPGKETDACYSLPWDVVKLECGDGFGGGPSCCLDLMFRQDSPSVGEKGSPEGQTLPCKKTRPTPW